MRGRFSFGMQKFHNENHSDIAIRIYRNENKCYTKHNHTIHAFTIVGNKWIGIVG